MAYRGANAITMKANTALCLFLLGVALVLRVLGNSGSFGRRAAHVCAGAALLIGLLSCNENIMGWNLKIDQILAIEPITGMGIPAATGIVLAGAAILLLACRQRRTIIIAQALALALCVLALLSTIGYLYGATYLYAVVRLSGIAWSTAASLLILGLGLLCASPNQGVMGQVTACDAGGQSIRRLLVPMVLLPIAAGWFRLAGERWGWFDPAMGTGLMMLLFIVSFSTMVILSGRRVSKATAVMQASEEKYRNLFQNMTEEVHFWRLVRDEAGRIATWRLVDANPSALKSWGKTLASIQDKTTDEIFGPGATAHYIDIVKTVMATGRPYGYEDFFPHLDKHFRFTTIPLGDYFITTGADITSIKKTLEAQSLLAAIIECSDDAIISKSLDGVILSWNAGAQRLFGYEPQEIIGKPITVLLPADRIHEEEELLQRLSRGERSEHVETIRLTRDGRRIDVSLTASPVKDSDGRVMGASKILHDISQRKRAEQALAAAAEELGRSNKDLEQFAYVASHDLQEPLRMVTGFLQLLDRRYKDKMEPDAREFIAFAVDGAARMSRLIIDLLDYSRINTRGRPAETVSMEGVLERALGNLQAAIAESGASITHDALPEVEGDGSQLTQLLQNLVGNAIKFRAADRHVEVHIGAARQDEDWVFSVKDNGIGIEQQYGEKVFLIFQRLHSRGEYPGTGIGLAICKRIVERHRGRIWVESQLGRGSTFFFQLPVQGVVSKT